MEFVMLAAACFVAGAIAGAFVVLIMAAVIAGSRADDYRNRRKE